MRPSSSDRGITRATSQPARLYYARLRASLGHDSRIAVLHIGPEQTSVTAGTTLEPQDTLTLAVGWQRTAREQTRQALPTARELEAAIAAVEDALTPALPLIDSSTALYTRDAVAREIALAAGLRAAPDLVLPLDAVEGTFNRLAAVAHGSPAKILGIPDSADFAAALLILRELMHHTQLASITITV